MLDLYNMSKARCGDREGFLGAPWPASPAYSESPRPERGLTSKTKQKAPEEWYPRLARCTRTPKELAYDKREGGDRASPAMSPTSTLLAAGD